MLLTDSTFTSLGGLYFILIYLILMKPPKAPA